MNKIIQWNVNGIRSRNDDLNILIADYNPDIICISETRLTPDIPYTCKGYNLHRKDRDSPNGGGGLMTLTKSNIGAKIINPTNGNYDREYLIVETVTNNKVIHYISIYDNNGHGNAKKLEHLVNNIPGSKLVLGDFNTRCIMWGSPFTTPAGDKLNECFNNCNLCLLNNGDPTYINPKTRSTSHLDLSLCTADLLPNAKWEVLQTGTSDHDPILIQNECDKTTWNNARKTWKIKFAKWDNYQKFLTKHENHLTNNNNNINDMANCFTTNVINAAEKTIGSKIQKPNTKPLPPWWNKDLNMAIKNRNKAKNKAKMSKNLYDYIHYKKQVATTKRLMIHNRNDSWNQFMETVTPSTAARLIWRRAKNKSTQSNYSYPTLTRKDNSKAITDFDRAAALLEPLDIHKENDQIATNLNNMYLKVMNNTYDDYNQPLTKQELENAIKTLKDGATGPDLIHNAFLRHLPNTYKDNLLTLYNKCWDEGCLPDIWKEANMLPILKKGKAPSLPANYRPIMLTSCTLKLYEKMIAKRFTHFLEINHLIPNYQYGFRAGIGCEEALDSFTSDIKTACSRNQFTVCAFIDAKGAFNNVRKEAILASLRGINTPNKIYNFCANYLTDRIYKMTIGNSTAQIKTSHGVPQGGVMAPHLFSIVMNRIPPSPTQDISPGLYADDCKIHSSNHSLNKAIDNVNKALQITSDNAKTWDIAFDPEKSKVIIFRTKRKAIDTNTINIQLDNKKIDVVNNHKFLGITFDHHLNWKDHVEALQKTSNNHLNLLRSVAHQKWGNSQKAVKILYLTLIRSRFTYGLISYGDNQNKYLHKLEKLQNHAIRIALGVPPSSANSAIHILIGIPHLKDYRDYLLMKNACKRASYNHYDMNEAKEFNECTVLKWPAGKPAILHAQTLIEKHKLVSTLNNIEENNRIPNNPPWTENTNLEFFIDWCPSSKRETNSAILRCKFLEIYNSISIDKTVIYTDGSLDPNTQDNGIGIHTPSANTNLQYKIHTGPAISTIELYAIQIAIEWATSQGKYNILIISDSQSALKTIQSQNIHYNTVDYIYSLPRETKITFLWTPSHCDVKGNEVADSLAKLALSNQDTPTKGIIPYNDILKVIKNKLKEYWIAAWKNGTTGRLLASIQEKPGDRTPYNLQNRKLESAINRLCCDRANLGYYRHLIMKINTPDCNQCNTKENTEHYLLHCNKYNQERKILNETLITLNTTISIQNLIGGQHNNETTQKKVYEALGNFINKTIGFETLLGKPPNSTSQMQT